MLRRLFILAILVSLATGGSALAVIGGSPDNGAHPYVGAVRGGGELCSGSLLSATVFVTAAHCFADGSTVQVTFDENADASATYYSGTVHNDPAWCLGCGPVGDTNDIAVVVLRGKGAPQSRYAQLPSIGFDDTLPNNQSVDVVGYGIQAFVKNGSPVYGTRQVATTTVMNDNKTTEFLKLSANPGSCAGDSGGPDLISGTDLVVSDTTLGTSDCKGFSYSERLDTTAAQGFIRSFSKPLQRAARRRGSST